MPIVRDLAIVAVALFMLVHETTFSVSPNPYVIGAGLTLLGVPPALRIDRRRRPDNDEDPYDGPGGYYRG